LAHVFADNLRQTKTFPRIVRDARTLSCTYYSISSWYYFVCPPVCHILFICV